jgi:hypothetical protein
MFPRVTHASYLGNYKIRLRFKDGHEGEIDLTNELYGEIFEPLKDLELFKQFKVNSDTHTIEWPNGADFAPEFLYDATHVPA